MSTIVIVCLAFVVGFVGISKFMDIVKARNRRSMMPLQNEGASIVDVDEGEKALVLLFAKMVSGDSGDRPNARNIVQQFFRDVLNMSAKQEQELLQLYDTAPVNDVPVSDYAIRVRDAYQEPASQQLIFAILEKLGEADGGVSSRQREFLSEVKRVF